MSTTTVICAHAVVPAFPCERVHVGNIVRVVYAGLGGGMTGTVTAVEGEVVTVNFPDGVLLLDGELLTEDLFFNEAELEVL